MKINQMFFKVLFSTLIMSTALSAQDQKVDCTKKIEVGTRELSQSARVALKEQRAKLVKEQETDGLECKDEVQAKIKATKSLAKGAKATVYYTTHEGVWHHPIAVSLMGDSVELEDGSIWNVYSGHTYKTLDWMTGDIIIIKPNSNCFSVYDYRLVNLNTGASVKVNLSLGPVYNGVYTHWVVGIDYYQREVFLEDGSIWKMSSWDSSTVDKWLINDTVIIGINDGFLSGSNPNILINVNMNNYAIGTCLN